MSVIALANAKGGSGKTTLALLLACALEEQGKRICLVDGDQQKWTTGWARLPGRPSNISIIEQTSPALLGAQLAQERMRHDHIIVDLEGTANLLTQEALMLCDLALIPVQGCAMDAQGAVKILDMIKGIEHATRSSLRHAVVLTRMNPAIPTRAARAVQTSLQSSGIPVLETVLAERAAYRDMMGSGGSLMNMAPTKTSNLDKAIHNARCVRDDVLNMLQGQRRHVIGHAALRQHSKLVTPKSNYRLAG